MVERRLHILMISWRPDERAASAFLSRYPSTKGPFQTERAMARPLFLLLPRVAARNDELGGRLVPAGLLALGRKTPRRDRMPAARGAALAAAMGMIDRVHGDAAVVRPPAEPARPPRLTDADVHVVGVGDRAGARHAAAVHQPLLRQDIGRFPVLVAHQRDEPGPVRIVLDALDAAGHVEFAPLEIDAAVSLLVTAAAKTHGGPPVVVAPARGTLALGQHLDRLASIEAGAVDQNQLAAARGDRLVGLECHVAAPSAQSPVVTSIL